MASPKSPDIPAAKIPPVKLRGSCHACALSKLKCSQDKPTCARCIKRGTTCQYLASKRAGRKQGSRASSFKPSPIKKTDYPTSGEKDDDRRELIEASTELMQYALQQDRNVEAYRRNHCHQRTPSYPESIPSLLSSAGPGTSATSPLTFEPPDYDGFLASPISLSMLDAPDMDYFPGADMSVSDVDGFPDPSSFFPPGEPIPMPEDNIVRLGFVHSPIQTNLPSVPLTPGVTSTGTPQQCFCFSRALTLLRELFPNSSLYCVATSNDTGGTSSPTIQQVIAKNEQTLQEATEIIECFCSEDGYTLTIITLAVFKVLAWYSAVAHVSPAREHSQTSEQIDRTAAVIRGYHIEGEDRDRMAAQLVLGELHRVQRLVSSLYQRLKDQGSCGTLASSRIRGVNSIGHDLGLPFHLLDRLAVDLGARLRGLSSEIVDQLRRC
ncbi:aflatoxin regulatory protein-domain-containing protein [Aspergillus desertorum]